MPDSFSVTHRMIVALLSNTAVLRQPNTNATCLGADPRRLFGTVDSGPPLLPGCPLPRDEEANRA